MEGTDLRAAAPAATRRNARNGDFSDPREPALRRCLGWLPDDRFRDLVGVSKIERVRPRAIINVSRDMVRFVLEGAVRVQYAAGPRGAKVVLIIGRGGLLSKLFFKDAPKVRAQAMTHCALLTLPRKPFLEAVIGTSSDDLDKAINLIFGPVLDLLARYWQTLGDRLMVRLAAVLVELARKFGVADSRGTLIDLKLSQRDLTGMVGCSRQQLHALLEELAERQIALRQGRQLILNVDELKHLARKA
jgi:CRP-like cAMP-binding protein